ncbi:MAG: LamG domain-containing protein, partial [Planctomycetes bacterium]|nr:LamG domain-containing protein [Planctomycetota bacterium]
TYYWRVDEVNEAEETIVWAGPVWNLSIVPAVVVDDFEGYGNLSPDRPFQTWLDGFGYSVDEFFPVPYGGNGTGSGIGHDVWTLTSPHYDGDIMETVTVINGSTQSMPLYFDGSSQTDRTFTPAQDWTLGGVTTLSIAVKGNAGLSAANTLYAKINGTRVQYGGDLTVPIWKPWHVDLTTLGINLNSVTTLSIGVEGSGSGVVLLDDILLHKTAPVINEPPAGSDMSLVAHWKLDETEGLDVADSSGYGNNGVLIGMDGSEWTTGHNGGALAFSGVSGNAASGNYVRFENATNLQLTDSATISAWVKLNEGNDGVYMGIAGKLISGQYKGFALVRHSSNVFRLWCNDAGFNLAGAEASSDATYTDTEWHHLAGVVDDGTSTLYVDGVRQIQEGAVDLIDSGTYAHIGKQYSDDSSHRYWNGLVDEVRIYYRALSEQEVQGL